MTKREKELKLNDFIYDLEINHWLATNENGFHTLQTGSSGKFYQMLFLFGVLLLIMFLKATPRVGETPAWFKWFAFLSVLGVLLASAITLNRKTIFDLENDVVKVTVFGISIFHRSLSSFEKFSFDPGYIVNGVDPGGVLYMHFKNGGKMRVVQLRHPDDLQNLQRFILGALKLWE
ncbi:MAG: hypothetical protein JNL70_06220 [Saprospiraceae bacterium]|nr:hypothetical protein [Saprospiraceae bacterium]